MVCHSLSQTCPFPLCSHASARHTCFSSLPWYDWSCDPQRICLLSPCFGFFLGQPCCLFLLSRVSSPANLLDCRTQKAFIKCCYQLCSVDRNSVSNALHTHCNCVVIQSLSPECMSFFQSGFCYSSLKNLLRPFVLQFYSWSSLNLFLVL